MRVVSLSPSVTDALVYIGAGDELVGVSVFCRPYAPPHAEVVGDYLSVRVERLRELGPDLVFTSGEAQEGLARRIASLGYRVVHVPIPESLHGVPQLVWRVGVEVGRVREALVKAEELAERLSRLRGSAPPRRVFYVIDLGEPVSPGALSYAGHALLYLGVGHAFESVRARWVKPTLRDVNLYRPDVIVYEGKVEEPTVEHARGALVNRWGLVTPDRLGRVKLVVVPRDTLAHYGPRIAERLEMLAERLR